jgi:hypothetical protein
MALRPHRRDESWAAFRSDAVQRSGGDLVEIEGAYMGVKKGLWAVLAGGGWRLETLSICSVSGWNLPQF